MLKREDSVMITSLKFCHCRKTGITEPYLGAAEPSSPTHSIVTPDLSRYVAWGELRYYLPISGCYETVRELAFIIGRNAVFLRRIIYDCRAA